MVVWLAVLVTSGGSAWWWLVVEGVSLCFAVWGMWSVKSPVGSGSALAVPVFYAVGAVAMFGASYSVTVAGSVCGLVASVVVFWALVALGKCYTVGPARWAGLVDYGPYRFVRHPQQSARCLVVVGAYLSGLSWPLAVVALLASAGVVVCEEAFLRREAEYREYVERVPWLFLPGYL